MKLIKHTYVLMIVAALFVGRLEDSYADYQVVQSNDFNLTLSYNQLADHFHVFDHLTESVPGFFLIPEYKTYWIEKFGELSQSDLFLFKQYQSLRKKYQNMDCFGDLAANKEGGLFAPNPQEVSDPIADAFYTSDSIEKALELLEKKLEKHELEFISYLFRIYGHNIQKFITFNQENLTEELKWFHQELANPILINNYFEIINFYQVTNQNFKSILIFWMPNKQFQGACYGDHLQIMIPINELSIDDERMMSFLTSVIVHEAIHHISGSMPSNKKQELSTVFLSTVESLDSSHFLNLIEEPLVMAHQMRLIKHIYPSIYSENGDWFNHPLAKEFLLILEEYAASKKSIDSNFIIKLAEIYQKNTV